MLNHPSPQQKSDTEVRQIAKNNTSGSSDRAARPAKTVMVLMMVMMMSLGNWVARCDRFDKTRSALRQF